MNAGKSVEILKIAHNYEERGKFVVVLAPSIDDRYGIGKVTSRMGMSRSAVVISKNDDIEDILKLGLESRAIDCILVDESQFLTYEHIMQLVMIVDTHNVPVICYGLKSDFQGNLFEGSYHLLVYADSIEEVKTICWFCDRKAIFNMRTDENGEIVVDGDQIEIGGNDKYVPVCRKDFLSRFFSRERSGRESI